MKNLPSVRSQKPLTASEIKAQVQLIQEVMNAVMKEGHHYGVIPGTPKPTLYKPGAEKLLSTFRIGADPTELITDLSTEDEIRYRVAVRGFSQATDNLLGVGVGECSSNEEKYKWRKPVCDEEFEETQTERKRIAWKRGDKGPYQQKQIRMNPSDVANTILKIAKKRALVDMTLTITAASDIFDQDLEDLPDEMELGANGKTPINMPKEKKVEPTPAAKETNIIITPIDRITKKDVVGQNKKPYMIYSIHIGDKTYSTFSKTFAEDAQKAIESGLMVKMEYKGTKYGPEIVSLKIEEKEQRS